MEYEIANVAAACSMRGFRYMAFPPIVFEALPVAPLSVRAEAAEALEAEALPVAPAEIAVAAPVIAAALPEPVPALPVAAVAPRAMPDIAVLAERPVPRRTAIPTPISIPIPPPATPGATPRFALLADVTAEIRRLGSR